MNNGSFIISLDFELFWGFIDSERLTQQKKRLQHTRTVVTDLIRFFEKNNMKVTWSTVGILMLEGSDDLNKIMNENSLPNYKNPKFNNYKIFNKLLSEKNYTDDVFFASELVEQLKASNFQDIGTHTFSHYFCLEKGQTKEDFIKDLSLSMHVANQNNISIKSIIFPRNQYTDEYLSELPDYGINIYRGNPDQFIYKTRREDNLIIRALHLLDTYLNIAGNITHPSPNSDNNLYNIKASRFLRPLTGKNYRFKILQLRRIKNEMTHAAKNNRYYHLWWHPHNFSGSTEENFKFLQEIINHFKHLNDIYNFSSESMESYVEKVKAHEKNHHDMR